MTLAALCFPRGGRPLMEVEGWTDDGALSRSSGEGRGPEIESTPLGEPGEGRSTEGSWRDAPQRTAPPAALGGEANGYEHTVTEKGTS